uniref:CSON000308 protein n=1 Tax=Culicoides sonorensis TaxID=179676 RepID=A0A336MEB1_CULSO
MEQLNEIEKLLKYIRKNIEHDKSLLGLQADQRENNLDYLIEIDENNNNNERHINGKILNNIDMNVMHSRRNSFDNNNYTNNRSKKYLNYAHVLPSRSKSLIEIQKCCVTGEQENSDVVSCSEAIVAPVQYNSVRLNRPTEEELLKWDLYRHQDDLPKPWTFYKLNKSVYRPPENIRDDYNGQWWPTKENNPNINDEIRDKNMNLNNNHTNTNNNNINQQNNLNNNKLNIKDPKTNPWKAREGNEIDQWVTDAFYSYFPSLNESRREKKQKLARDRQQDYNNFVKQIPVPVPKREQLRQKREQYLNQVKRSELTSASSNDGSSSPVSSGARPGTPKHRLLQDLQHIGLPAMLQTDVVEQREKKSAEEEAEKRAIYQKELLRQIEEKKRNLEKLRKQQEEEEYRVTRELENQLLTLRLEEELAKQGKKLARTQAIANRDTLRRQALVNRLVEDKNIAADSIEKAMHKNLIDFNTTFNIKNTSDNKKPDELQIPNLKNQENQRIYTYFTNSAKVDKQLTNSSCGGSSSSSTADDLLVLPHINRYQYCKKCRTDIDDSYLNLTSPFSSSTPSELNHTKNDMNANRIKSCFHCHILDHKLSDKLCQDCNKTFKKLSNGCHKCQNSKDSCEFCNKNDFNYCPFCVDRHQETKSKDLNNNLSPEQIFNNVSVVPIPKRYIDEQNRLPKFINNENDSSVRRSALQLKPLMIPKTAGSVQDSKLTRKSGSFRRLEAKWEVPAVRRFSMSQNYNNDNRVNGPIETYTEIGAFKKQLQAEKIKETASE